MPQGRSLRECSARPAAAAQCRGGRENLVPPRAVVDHLAGFRTAAGFSTKDPPYQRLPGADSPWDPLVRSNFKPELGQEFARNWPRAIRELYVGRPAGSARGTPETRLQESRVQRKAPFSSWAARVASGDRRAGFLGGGGPGALRGSARAVGRPACLQPPQSLRSLRSV